MAVLNLRTFNLSTNRPGLVQSDQQTIDFLSVRIGASNLAISETSGDFDFNGVDIRNANLPASPSNYTPANALILTDHLAAIDTALASAGGTVFSDADFAIQDDADNTKELNIQLSGLTTSTTRVLTMADADVDLSDVLNIYTLSGVSQGATGLGTFTGTTISDNTSIKSGMQQLETAVELRALDSEVVKVDGSAAFTADQSMGGNKLTNLGTPTAAGDAATKAYVDGISAGLDPKESVRLATTADLSATYNSSGGAGGTGQFTGAPTTIDGVAIAQGDRILVKDQSTQTQNGIYVVTATTTVWDRASDQDGSPAAEVSGGNYTFVEQGTANSGVGYVVIGDGTLTLNTDNIVWSTFSDVSLTAGDGIDLSGNVVSADLLASGGLKFVSGELAVEPADFAGSGLEDDGSDNLRISAAAAGNGLAGGAGSALSVQADSTGGANLATVVNVSANGVAVAIDDTSVGENGSNQLEVKDSGITTAKIADDAVDADKINSNVAGLGLQQASDGSLEANGVASLQNDDAASFAAGEFGVIEADGNVVKAQANGSYSLGTTFVMALEAIASAATGKFAVGPYKLGGFSTLAEEEPVYLSRSTAGDLVQNLTGFANGEHVVLLGQAISTTEILFNPTYIAEYNIT